MALYACHKFDSIVLRSLTFVFLKGRVWKVVRLLWTIYGMWVDMIVDLK